MEPLAGILIKALLFAFIAGMFTLVISMFMRRRREDARIRNEWSQIAQIAPERGWTYDPCTRGQIDQYGGMGPILHKGENQAAWHYTTGEFRGRSFKYFEYRYKRSAVDGDVSDFGDHRRLVIKAVFIVTAPGSGSYMEILRRSKLGALADGRPGKPLGVPEFDKEFRVLAKDETFFRSALNGDIASFMLADPRAKRAPLRFRDDELITWYTGTLSPQTVDEKLNYLCDVLDRIPEQAWTTA
ncbi:hypothetical protein QQY66_36860 [Streptomyces sp. DG2A-72]|uniref:hypothetical protein n=1 Tax=Streptomyces sp. DG2A-72 TaxID=3051386 RepID=UPI00265C2BDC|nr:hypothetical protein [Streptomyces sp. DG2A-72]MDO0937020.1 hypothetical protein [Streptomyces sp. DG2A-72]